MLAKALLMLCAATTPLTAQKIVEGPQIVKSSDAEYVIETKLDTPSKAVFYFWKPGEEQYKYTINLSASATHEAKLSNKEEYFYAVGIPSGGGEFKTNTFRTVPLMKLAPASAKVSDITVNNGNQLSFNVDGVYVTEYRVTVKKGNDVVTAENKSLKSGQTTVTIVVPPEDKDFAARVHVDVMSGSVPVGSGEKDVIIRKPIETPKPPRFGSVELAPTKRGAKIATSFDDVPNNSSVFYKLITRVGKFSWEQSGSCRAEDCKIDIVELAPGTKYTYTLSAAATPAGPWVPWKKAGVESIDFTTESLPKLTTAPSLVFPTDGDGKADGRAFIKFATDKATKAQIVYAGGSVSGPLSGEVTPLGALERQIQLEPSLAFKKLDESMVQTQFTVVLYDAADNVKLGEIPVQVVGDFQAAKKKDALKAAVPVIERLVKEYGPQIGTFLKTNVAPVIMAAVL